ncbi:TPA: tRNA uridine-5-carboxymethylaminomethyl(34) synthesis GTPase MnmE [bacterium]|nr:tRNA uridine-5-carboxymethylaminomethyl(34) synthesis GTPase MnmE [bacterium]
MNDTIAAISTPPGIGGIGIVRISGPKSLKIAKKIFRSKKPIENRKLIYGKIINKDEVIDEVLLSYHKAPYTYTREDIVEINIHSGLSSLKETLSLVISCGARLAEPGEFTKRAYLSGRIDLSQAEAVSKIVSAKTELARKIAVRELGGSLSLKIKEIREGLLSCLSYIEAGLDFEEELDKEGIYKDTILLKEKLDNLILGYRSGRYLSDCAIGVIVGKPNVGKSSILNALLGTKRAIVTPIPGTTRDLVSEIINIKGIPLKIVDTAGLCFAIDIVEKEGIEMAWAAIETSDIVILVFDGSVSLTDDDLVILEKIKKDNLILCVNKCDLPLAIDISQIKNYPIVYISAKEGNISPLVSTIEETLFSSFDENNIITSIRHKEAIEKAIFHLERAIHEIDKRDEIASIELRASIDSLSGIIGEKITDEDILDKIFFTFCIGK